MRSSTSLVISLILISISSAWPWPASFNKASPNDIAATATNTGVRETGTATGTSNPTGSITSAPSSQASSDSNLSGNTTVYDPRDPPGGVSMISPAPTTTQYYKIGDWIHFAWNYTSLQATPTAINVVASCSANNHVYTLASNQTISPTGAVYWDTGAYQANAQVPLLTEQYTLIIWDAAKAMSAPAAAGYLSSFSQFRFGMYSPQPYSNLSSFQCATCPSNAATSLERMTLGFLTGMVTVTVLSASWFVSGANIF